MFNDNNTGFSMPVAPIGYGGYGNGNGFFGGDGIWALLVLALLFGGGFGGWGMMNGMWGMDGAFPWLLASNANNQNATQDGFNQAATANTLASIQNGITSGFGDVQLGIAGVNQNICQTGNSITSAITNGFAQSEIADNARQIANMQQAFNAQTAVTAGINGLSSQFADCCCENRLGLANLNSTILSENCADRAAISDGVRDIITNQTAGVQRILDQMCQDKIDAKNERIVSLENQLNMAQLAASQTAQTSRLLADNAAQTQQIENYVRPQINPAYIVPNPYAYNFNPSNGWNGGCCGCGNFSA